MIIVTLLIHSGPTIVLLPSGGIHTLVAKKFRNMIGVS